jgi:hypothetical protein
MNATENYLLSFILLVGVVNIVEFCRATFSLIKSTHKKQLGREYLEGESLENPIPTQGQQVKTRKTSER